MKKLSLFLLLLSSYALAAETVDIPRSGGSPILQHSSGKPINIQTVMTTDGNGNLIPVSSGIGSGATAANQVTGNNSLAAINTNHPGDLIDTGNTFNSGGGDVVFTGTIRSTIGYQEIQVSASGVDVDWTATINYYADLAGTILLPGSDAISASSGNAYSDEKAFRPKGAYYNITIPSCGGCDGAAFLNTVLKVISSSPESAVNLAGLSAKFSALGPNTMANSTSVVVASNQSAIPVSGPLTDTQLRATAVPVSGPVTDAQLRATAVPVSLTVLPSLATGTNNIGTVTAQYATRSDTFIATGNGVTVDLTAKPLKSFSLSVRQTGVVTSWDVRLECSLDNITFTQVIAHTNVTGDGVTVSSGATLFPCLYFRSRASGLVLGTGTNVIATILGTQ